LEGDTAQKAERIKSRQNRGRCKKPPKLATMVECKLKFVWTGHEEKARENFGVGGLVNSQQRTNQIDQILSGSLVFRNQEKSLGLSKGKAKRVNDQGMGVLVLVINNDAIELFKSTSIKSLAVPAFKHLIYCSVLSDIKKSGYKGPTKP